MRTYQRILASTQTTSFFLLAPSLFSSLPIQKVLQNRQGKQKAGTTKKASLEMVKLQAGASLVAQWWRICLLSAGDTGSSPGLGRSHMPRSNWAREPQLLSLRVWSLCSATRGAAIMKRPAHRDEAWPPPAATRGSPRTETKTQHSQK